MKKITVSFPLENIHEGTTLGNGVLGLSLWGGERLLNLSMGSSILWDHRGGMPWTERQNYKDIRKALEANNESEIRALFSVDPPAQKGDPERPSLIPLGRMEITLPPGGKAERIELDLLRGIIKAVYRREGKEKTLRIVLSQKKKGAFALKGEENLHIRIRPAYELSDALRSVGFVPPEILESGFRQDMPNDPGFRVEMNRTDEREWDCLFVRAPEVPEPENRRGLGFRALAEENRIFWKKFWNRVPEISCPDEEMEKLYVLGLFKFQSMASADGPAPGLQGPWIEDDAFPPWSGDYHFNINVQMCCSPAYHSGLLENLKPLFRMILSQSEKLRQNARCFSGIEDGRMLPHAVDDRCVCMGAFWTGCIDHACAAWVAQMMAMYVRCSGDVKFLKEGAFDFMRGVMRVYETMLEEENGALVLPVGVSPEYRGDRMNAWGANASFQLAAVHRLAEDLIEAAKILNIPPEPFWIQIQERLPKVTLEENAPGRKEFALWRGTLPEESHRHHSHLASLYPFDVIRADDPEYADAIRNSRDRWISLGMGRWAGWSYPWAVMLHNRFGNAGMAVTLIDFWKRCYTNKGNGTLHDPGFGGVSLGLLGNSRVMQMDAAMGMVTAVADLFIYESRGILYLLHGIPDSWKSFEVKRIHCSNRIEFSARRKNGVTTVVLSAEKGTHLCVCIRGEKMEFDLAAGGKRFFRMK